MIQHNNIIAFPETPAVWEGRPFNASGATAPAIIDLSSRRKASAKVLTAQGTAQEQTPGEVWDALNDGRVQVHYQPQYDMATGSSVAAEALVRLIDTEGLLVYPDCFIEMVEQRDLIVPLGRAVIEQACTDLAACRAQGIALQRIAVNLSARQINIDTGLVGFIDQMIARHGLSYGDLEFELTERQSLTPQCEGLVVIHALAERGSRIVIDDFGTGYSSLMYLTELPISAFKLDRSLIMRLPEDKARQAIVKNMLVLAETLELEVVAEGIETQAQNEYLAHAGCPYGQGFGFAKPMAIGDLQSFMTDHAAVSQPNQRYTEQITHIPAGNFQPQTL